MAEFATIARPYAKALFGLAQEKNQIESWLGGLEKLAAVAQEGEGALLFARPGTKPSE
ncbi:F0F1 ATP synthase subunit delta, partial [Salmonella enterica subsp. enterica serovar Infantis]